MVVWSRDWPSDRRVASSIPETTDFLTNSSGQATNAHVSLFTKQHKLVPADYIAGWEWGIVCINATQSHSGEHLVAKRLYMQSWNIF